MKLSIFAGFLKLLLLLSSFGLPIFSEKLLLGISSCIVYYGLLRVSEMGCRSDSPHGSSRATSIPSIGSSFIPVVNKLREILTPVGGGLSISLPEVVVIGSQSSGKSSVLESLVGRDFLPRGCGICTRRPLVLMLENNDEGTEWGEFDHLPGKRITDFAKIRKEIQAETEREAGTNKGVSDKQIRLKIFSPNVLDMTLIDLPGITKVPVGDQPFDIENKIRKLILFYIRRENCIILAVSPANSDLATSDALAMAREADPTGSRTIGVITKIDIMDRGTSARNFLLNKVIPLQLGYIGVVNRSQEAINKTQPMSDALAYEEQFFNDNHAYQGLFEHCGIPHLAKRLNQILDQHIRKVIPSLKSDLNCHMSSVGKELNIYGEAADSKVERGAVLSKILTKYCETFFALVDGKSHSMTTKELSGGARIHFIFQSIFVKSLEDVDPCDGLSDDDITTAIQNATGPKNALFVPEVPFEILVKRQIARLLDPSIQCVHFVLDELVKMAHACELTETQRFPALRKRLHEVVGRFFRDRVKPAERMIVDLIDMEKGYINSSHPNFIGGSKAVDLALRELKSYQESTKAEVTSTSEKDKLTHTIFAQPVGNHEQSVASGNTRGGWVIPSIFGNKSHSSPRDYPAANNRISAAGEPPGCIDVPAILLKGPPSSIRSQEVPQREVETVVIKLLLRSYFGIVKNNIQDLVPKTIMHFMVNHSKRELHNTFIQSIYREELFEEMLREHEHVLKKRKQIRDVFHSLQLALQELDEVDCGLMMVGGEAVEGSGRVPAMAFFGRSASSSSFNGGGELQQWEGSYPIAEEAKETGKRSTTASSTLIPPFINSRMGRFFAPQ